MQHRGRVLAAALEVGPEQAWGEQVGGDDQGDAADRDHQDQQDHQARGQPGMAWTSHPVPMPYPTPRTVRT